MRVGIQEERKSEDLVDRNHAETSQMFQHKGDLLITSLNHLGLKCLRRDDFNPYISTSYLHLDFWCRNNMPAFAGQEWLSSLRVFALYSWPLFQHPMCGPFRQNIHISMINILSTPFPQNSCKIMNGIAYSLTYDKLFIQTLYLRQSHRATSLGLSPLFSRLWRFY